MATTIARITGTVRAVGKNVGNAINPRGLLLDIKVGGEMTVLGITVEESRALGMLLGKEVTITVTTEESLPGVES
jgi:hypothetical protein